MDSENLWNVYSHIYLDNFRSNLLTAQASKLRDLSGSIEIWDSSGYGQTMNFSDDRSSNRVREIWEGCCCAAEDSLGHGQWERDAQRAVQRAMHMRISRFGDSSTVVSGTRSAAPAGLAALRAPPNLAQQYSTHGTIGTTVPLSRSSRRINPMFATRPSTPHHVTNPLLGLRLALASIPPVENSPHRLNGEVEFSLYRLLSCSSGLGQPSVASLRIRESTSVRRQYFTPYHSRAG